MLLNKSRKRDVSRSDCDEHPKASTTHSIPLMVAVALHLGLSAFRTEFSAARDGLAALAAEFCFGSGSSGHSGCRSTGRPRSRFLHGVHHGLAHGYACTETRAHTDGTSAFIPGRNGDGLCHLILRELAHVAEHVHADALVEHFLQLVWKRKIFDHKTIQGKSIVRESGLESFADLFGKRALVRGHIEEGHLAGGERIGHSGDDGV